MNINMTDEQGVGRAYGFLNCDRDYATVDAALKFAQKETEAPSGLELTLTQGIQRLQAPHIPEQLRSFAQQASQANMKYLVEASLPSATNEATAQALNHIIGQLYNDPDLYEAHTDMRYEVVREANGTYEYVN